MRVFYSPQYVSGGPAFDTTRKAAWVAGSLVSAPIPGVSLEAPPRPLLFPCSRTEHFASLVHSPEYLDALKTGHPKHLAESNEIGWDAQLWPMVLASTCGVVAAAESASVGKNTGSLSSGMHHARRDHGAGYCTINGLAIAALAALSKNTRDVLIIDLDAHCGGGTHSLIRRDQRIWHLDISTDTEDCYEPDSNRHTLDIVGDAKEYLPTLRRRLDEMLTAYRFARQSYYDWDRFGLVIYNAGMDPYEGCAVGGLRGITADMLAERERIVFEWCRSRSIPVAFVLAGGYVGPNLTESKLVDLHRLTIAAAA